MSDVCFVGLRLRLETRSGHRPEPVELNALARRGATEVTAWSVHNAVVPPEPGTPPPPPVKTPVPEPAAGSLAAAFAEVERRVGREEPHALVATHGFIEKTLVWEQRPYCPRLASCPLLDVMALAAIVQPTATPLGFDARLRLAGIEIPPDRSLSWDTDAMMRLFHTVVSAGVAAGRWSSLEDLVRAAGSVPPPIEPEFMPELPVDVQESLFD